MKRSTQDCRQTKKATLLLPQARGECGTATTVHAPLVLLSAYLLILTPSWHYLLSRTLDGSDEPWGLVSLALIVNLYVQQSGSWRRQVLSSRIQCVVLALLTVYSLTLGVVSNLLSLLLGLFGLGILASNLVFRRHFHQGFVLLHLLCAPILPSLSFYAGFPVRSLIAICAAQLLKTCGFATTVSGTSLVYQGTNIFVDAPCAGMKLLWLGLILGAFLGCQKNLRALPMLVLLACASLCTFVLNVLRVSILFFPEAGIISLPPQIHGALGAISALWLCAALLLLSKLLEDRRPAPKTTDRRLPAPHSLTSSAFQGAPSVSWTLLRSALLLVCLIQGFTVARSNQGPSLKELPPDRAPANIEYRDQFLVRVPLSDREMRFARDFPGSISRYASDEYEILIRQVRTPSRRLHPSSDCLRGAGFAIRPAPAERDPQGDLLSCVFANLGTRSLRVCEKIVDQDGRSFPDASTWYWHALLGKSAGPWKAYTISRAETS